jgi:predicted nucleic acid-binding protein
VRRVFVDTSVLFPFSVMDLFLAMSENGLHEVVWTDELLAEWERVIVRDHQRSVESAASVTAAIRECFADSRIEPVSYRSLVAGMPGPDPGDHVHSAAALAAGVGALITWDALGFPIEALAERGLRVLDPDRYLQELFDEFPDDLMSTIAEIARSKTRPPMTEDDVLAALEKAGLRHFPTLIRERR